MTRFYCPFFRGKPTVLSLFRQQIPKSVLLLPEVARVVALIDRHNACLEQEALLLPAETLVAGGE
jgi:hypothetical protein